MADVGEIFNRLADELANVSAVFGTHGVFQNIPTFKGDSKTFKSWIRAIDKFCLISNITEDRKKNLIAYQTCEGPPSDFINRHLSDNGDVTWNDTKQVLQERFGEVYDAELAFSQLRNIRQKSDESVQIYAERIMTLATEAYDGNMNQANLPLIESQITNIFTEGLHDRSVKMACLRRNVTTLNEAVRIALGEQNIRLRFQLRSDCQQNVQLPQPMEVDALTQTRPNQDMSNHKTTPQTNSGWQKGNNFYQNGYKRPQYDRFQQRQSHNQFHHGSLEHRQRNWDQTRQFQNSRHRNDFQAQQIHNNRHRNGVQSKQQTYHRPDRQEFRSNIQCFSCGCFGHFARECTSRRPHLN